MVFGTAVLCASSLFENPENAMYNFPYHAWYPSFVPDSIKVIMMSSSTAWDAIIIVVHDCIIMTLMNHLCAQMLVLEESLKDLTHENYNKPPINEIKRCVRHHQKIYVLRNEIESFFSTMLMMQFFASLIIFGITGFQATVSTYRQFLVYAYCCCLLSQLFIYCWFAHQIIHQVCSVLTNFMVVLRIFNMFCFLHDNNRATR